RLRRAPAPRRRTLDAPVEPSSRSVLRSRYAPPSASSQVPTAWRLRARRPPDTSSGELDRPPLPPRARRLPGQLSCRHGVCLVGAGVVEASPRPRGAGTGPGGPSYFMACTPTPVQRRLLGGESAEIARRSAGVVRFCVQRGTGARVDQHA